MATAILFKNADLYAPEHKGIKQILTVNEKIIAVEDEISADLPGLEVIPPSTSSEKLSSGARVRGPPSPPPPVT